MTGQANQFDTECTFDKVATLKRLWAAGLPQSEIAAELGVTRNTIAGKISRLKLTRAPSPRQPRKARKQYPKKPAATSPELVRAFAVLLPEPKPEVGGVQLLQLTNATCRWPFGVVGTEAFHFCGVPTADFPTKPYCREHTNLARRT